MVSSESLKICDIWPKFVNPVSYTDDSLQTDIEQALFYMPHPQGAQHRAGKPVVFFGLWASLACTYVFDPAGK